MPIPPLNTSPGHLPHHDAEVGEKVATVTAAAARQTRAGSGAIFSAPPLSSRTDSANSGLNAPVANPSDVKDTLNKMASLSNYVGTDVHAMMALFQKLAQEMRDSARQLRNVEAQAQVQAELDAAQKIRDAAEQRMIGAIVSGSMQIAGGIGMAGSGAYGVHSLQKDNASDIYHAMNKYRGIADGAQGANAVGTGIGQTTQAAQDSKAAATDAEKSRLDAATRVHEQGRNNENEVMSNTLDVIKDIRDKLSAIEQSRLETTRGMARNL